MIKPIGSSCSSFPFQDSAGLAGGGRFGASSRSRTSETPPIGNIDPEAPSPCNGRKVSSQDQTKNRRNAKCRSPVTPSTWGGLEAATISVIMRYTPGVMPAPPMPVVALPAIKALEFRADAQTIEPISKTAVRMKLDSRPSLCSIAIP